MKLAEMRDLTKEELRTHVEALHKELYEARFEKATHRLEDTAVFRRKRHEIAQLNTVLRQKELQSQGERAHG
jgi:large subunit ribosomal protein L29